MTNWQHGAQVSAPHITPAGLRILVALEAAGPKGLSTAAIAHEAEVTPLTVKVIVHHLRAAGVPISTILPFHMGHRGREPGVYVLGQDQPPVQIERTEA